MIEKVKQLALRVHGFLHRIGVDIVLRRLLIPIVTVIVYLLPVGLTSIMVRVLRPKLLAPPEALPGSYWRAARGYEPDRERCLRQS